VKILINPFFWGIVIGIISLHIMRQVSYSYRSAPPPLFKIKEEWSLIDQYGKTFSSKYLNNHVVIMNLFFTRCGGICPKLINAMKRLQKKMFLYKPMHFVSITIDPDFDTYFVLYDYAKRNDILYDNWHFLTGKKSQIFYIVTENMHIYMSNKQQINKFNKNYDINHFNKLILLDRHGDIRDFFTIEDYMLAALERAVKLLIDNNYM